MSLADYAQTAEDHQSLLLLVRPTGSKIHDKVFAQTWDRIKRLNCIVVPGQKRTVWARYKHTYRKENNEWGDFQAHRKTLGLISVGQCSTVDEFDELFESYRREKENYALTLYNSRLIVLGMNRDGSPLSDADRTKFSIKSEPSGPTSQTRLKNSSPVPSIDSGVTPDLSPSEGQIELEQSADTKSVDEDNNKSVSHPLGEIEHENTQNTKNSEKDVQSQENRPENVNSRLADEKPFSGVTIKSSEKNEPKLDKRPHSNSVNKDSTGSEVVFYPSLETAVDVEDKIQEFVTSIFFVLEGKRLDRSFERQDRMQLLCAPFEKKDYVGLDTDTRYVKINMGLNGIW